MEKIHLYTHLDNSPVKSFGAYELEKALGYCKENNLIDEVYASQNDGDGYVTTIPMKEIEDVFNQGEYPYDLSFF